MSGLAVDWAVRGPSYIFGMEERSQWRIYIYISGWPWWCCILMRVSSHSRSWALRTALSHKFRQRLWPVDPPSSFRWFPFPFSPVLRSRIRQCLCRQDPDPWFCVQIRIRVRIPPSTINTKKNMISTFLWLLNELLSLKTDANVRYLCTVSNKQ